MINTQVGTLFIRAFPSRMYILKHIGITESEAKDYEDDILYLQGFLIEQANFPFNENIIISGVFSHAAVYNGDQNTKLVDSRDVAAKKKRPENIINTEKLDPDYLYLKPGLYNINSDGTIIKYLDDQMYKDDFYNEVFDE